MADRLARGFHDALPDGARELLAEQPLLIAAGSAPDGLVRASPLAGVADTPDERTVAGAGGVLPGRWALEEPSRFNPPAPVSSAA